MITKLHAVITFFKWRLIFTRYIMMLWNNNLSNVFLSKKTIPSSRICQEISKVGFCIMDPVDPSLVDEIVKKVSDRIPEGVINNNNAPFVNLIKNSDIVSDSPILKLAFSKEIFDNAIDYFSGNVTLDSIQVLYSCSGGGKPRESQLWHKDYGDSKSFHGIIYLNDVFDVESGPFSFIDKNQSKKITPFPVVRRIKDKDFYHELGVEESECFYGGPGSLLLVDPAVCYHHGSRGNKSRLAIFITFNSSSPYVKAQHFVSQNRSELISCAKKIRPDLSESFLNKVIRK